MLVFFGLASKTGRIAPAVCSRVEQLASRCVPFKTMPYGTATWLSPSGRTALFAWSNNPRRTENGSLIEEEQGAALAVTGYTSSPGIATHADLLGVLRTAEDPRRIVQGLGGVFAIAYANGNAEALHVWNSFVSLISVFWAEDDDYVCVSNRALLAHLFCRSDGRPRYDHQGLVAFLTSGHFANWATPYQDVRVLRQNTELRLSPAGSQLRSIDETEEMIGGGEQVPDEQYYDRVTEALLNALRPLKSAQGPIRLGLTGGKDSRIVASAMAKEGIEFSSYTGAEATHPDTVIGKQIAQILGVPHATEPPGGGRDTLRVDLHRRAVEYIQLTEGFLHIWCYSPLPRSFDPTIEVTGQGGEFLRGGWLKSPENRAALDTQKARSLVWSNFVRFPECFQPERIGAYEQYLSEWLDREGQRLSPEGVIEKLFFWIYGCRWAAASFMARLPHHQRVYPLCDQAFLKISQEVPPAFRIQDQVGYNILKRLDSRLLNLPFRKWRWAFEDSRPKDGNWRAWRDRAPLVADKLGRESVDWKQEVGGDLKREFAEQIFGSRSADELFCILDRRKLENLFFGPGIFETRAARFFFNVYTASVLLSNAWMEDISSIQDRGIVVRCDVRWWKVNRRICRLLESAANAAERLAGKRLHSHLESLAGRRFERFLDGYLEQLQRASSREQAYRTARQQFLKKVLPRQLAGRRLADTANRALTQYLRRLVTNLSRIPQRFRLAPEAWEDHLERFTALKSPRHWTLKDLLTSPSQVAGALAASEAGLEARLVEEVFPAKLTEAVAADRAVIRAELMDRIGHLTEAFLSLSADGVLAPVFRIHKNLLESLDIRA